MTVEYPISRIVNRTSDTILFLMGYGVTHSMKSTTTRDSGTPAS